MITQQLSLAQFVEALQVVIGLPIWKVIHPADGILHFDLGRKYADSVPGIPNPHIEGEVRIYVYGDWTLVQNGRLIASRRYSPDETRHDYFERMDVLEKNFPIKQIISVTYENGEVIFADAQTAFHIKTDGKADDIAIRVVRLDDQNIPLTFTHYRFEEKSNTLEMSLVEEAVVLQHRDELVALAKLVNPSQN